MFLGKLAAVLHLCFWVGSSRPAPDSKPTAASCLGGRPWPTGNRSCIDPDPFLLIGLENAILRMNLDGSDQKRVVSSVGNSILLDFHSREGRMYWVNTHTGMLSQADLNGTHQQKLLSLGKGISGMAIDWIENSIFWSNKKRGTIQRADTDGKKEKTVLRDLSQPSSLVVDPNERYLFWLSAGVTPSIQRSDSMGGMRTMVLKVPNRLLALALDPTDRKLFWVQRGVGKLSAIGSCDYNGNFINVINQRLRSKSLKMSLFLDYMYMTDSSSHSITRINKYTGGRSEKVNSKEMLYTFTDVKVIHPINQPVIKVSAPLKSGCDAQRQDCMTVCSSPGGSGQCNCRSGFTLSKQGGYCEDINECALWNHGCSLGCENVPGSYFCTCPKGYLLLPDTKTCHEIEPCVENGTVCDFACTHTLEGDVCVCPVGSVLQPDGHSCTGCLSVDRGGCSQVCVTLSPGRWECECQPGYQLQTDGKQCKSTGPPAYLLFANMVDIRKVSMHGSEVEKLLEEVGGSIIALDYDPLQNMVYFASTKQKRIEKISMNGESRELLLSTGLDSPEGLALDWMNRKLYWTDRGLSTISRISLDGLDRKVLISEKVLEPRGIVVHPQAKKLFWADMGVPPAVERSDLDGQGRTVLVSSGLISPSGLAVDYSSQRLYWCDVSTGLIESVSLDGSDRHTLRPNQVGRPFDIAVFEDFLLVSNWGDKLLYQLPKRSGHNPERLNLETVQPAALIIIHPLTKPVTESGEGKWGDRLKNKTLNDESLPVSDLPSDVEEPVAFTEKMVSDQDECFSLSCDVNAQCLLEASSAICRCLSGFTGDGQLCLDIDECTAGLAECSTSRSECVNTVGGYFCQCRAGFSGDGHHCIDIDECYLDMHNCDVNAECLNTLGEYKCRCSDGYTGSGYICHAQTKTSTTRPNTDNPINTTSSWRRPSGVESCPSTHESYCLYDGVCFYFPEMQSYGCNCVPGYMGERCQFSDLEWWEMQQAEQEKRRNVVIVVCMALLILLLTITASLTYCYRCRMFIGEHPKVDNMSETCMSEDSITETPSTSPQFCVVLDHGVCSDMRMLHVVGCQRREVCPSCTSETGESLVSEEDGTLKCDKKLLDSTKQSSFDILKSGSPSKPTHNLISLYDPQPIPLQLL